MGNKRITVDYLRFKKLMTLAVFVFLLILSFSLTKIAYAQNQTNGNLTVKGKVTSAADHSALPGVDILVKGTTHGTVTNAKGMYTLSGVSSTDTLMFSYIGYASKSVAVQGRTTINVKLKSSYIHGQQLVVVGYGTEKKENVTGSIATVSGSDLQSAPVPNVSNALAGQMPGVIVNNRSGEPGNNGSDIVIRGDGTLNNNNPLYVIDGVPSSYSDFNELNPTDIKSISVLKDASAAIYGSEAANGVILVTTKEGKKGKPKITYNGRFGETQPTRIPNHLNGWQYMVWRNEGDKAAGQPQEFTQKQIDALKNGTYNPRQYGNTDWERAILKPLSPVTTHQLQISGGSDIVTYLLSGQYLYQDGIYKHSATYYNQGNLRANIGVNVTKNLNISLKSSATLKRKHYSNLNGTSIFFWAKGEFPYLPVFYPNGDPSGSQALVNPLLIAEGKTGYNKEHYYIFNNNLSFKLKLPEITKGLYVHGRVAYDIQNWDSKLFTNRFHMYSYDPTTDTYIDQYSSETSGNGFATPMSVNQTFNKSLKSTYDIQLGYKNDFGPHHVAAFVAYEQYKFDHSWISAYRQGLLSDQIVQLNMGSSQQLNNGGSLDHRGLPLSNGHIPIYGGKKDFFGRITYNYKQKYLADIILRRDGSFRFPPNHRWGTFPAVSVGWRISKEPFFQNHVKFISDLKLKASWGRMGNSLIAPYQFQSLYSFGSGYNYGLSPIHYRGIVPGVAPNPDITWEVADKKDVGFTAQFFSGTLSMDFDYFFSKRNNILVRPNAKVPNYTGLQLPDENIGKVNNHGIDASLTYHNFSGAFHYKFAGNFTFARNKVVYMDESKNIPAWQRVTGHPMNSWLVYKTAGIYKNQQEINNSPHLPGEQPGDVKYIDVNGDGQITPNDMVRIFQSATPEIQYGINLTGGYKRFQLYMLWQGQARAKQLILPGSFHTPPEWRFTERWTPSNPNATIPRAVTRNNTIDNRPSTIWLKNASFIRLKTVRLSYTLSNSLARRLSLNRVQLYISGQNLFFISPIKHYDPELTTPDGQYYPQVRSFNVGASLSL